MTAIQEYPRNDYVEIPQASVELAKPSSLRVFEGKEQAVEWLLDRYTPRARAVLQPFFWHLAQEQTRDTLIEKLRSGYPLAFSEVRIEDNPVIVALLSELPPTTELHNGTLFYRTEPLNMVPTIIQHGFYMVPGRIFLFDKPHKAWTARERAFLAYRLDPRTLLTDTSEDFTESALPFDTSNMGVILPPEVKNKYPEPLTLNSPYHGGTQVSDGAQVLLWGEASGMLSVLKPSLLDVEETLRINEKAIGDPLLEGTQQKFDKIRDLLKND